MCAHIAIYYGFINSFYGQFDQFSLLQSQFSLLEPKYNLHKICIYIYIMQERERSFPKDLCGNHFVEW